VVFFVALFRRAWATGYHVYVCTGGMPCCTTPTTATIAIIDIASKSTAVLVVINEYPKNIKIRSKKN
jgi:hypothetical protein